MRKKYKMNRCTWSPMSYDTTNEISECILLQLGYQKMAQQGVLNPQLTTGGQKKEGNPRLLSRW